MQHPPLPGKRAEIVGRANAASMNLRSLDGDRFGIALDETTTAADVAEIWKVFAGGAAVPFTVADLEGEAPACVPGELARTSAFPRTTSRKMGVSIPRTALCTASSSS